MVYAYWEDRRPRELFQCYMRGWKHGTGGNASDPKFTEHEDARFVKEYQAGYQAGYESRLATQKAVANRLGYTPSVLRTQGKKP